MKFLILAEKYQAYKKFSQHLGGDAGTFTSNTGTFDYVLTFSQGHLLTLDDPYLQVDQNNDALVARYRSWNDFDAFPWNVSDFSWSKHFISPKSRSLFKKIKQQAEGCDGIIIATDNDPTGEGDLLGWEIINQLKWRKSVYRIRFADTEKDSFLEALRDMTEVINPKRDGYLLSGQARQRFDFMSMQLTRIATTLAKQKGYNLQNRAVPLGRLKSVILNLIYRQTIATEKYVKRPFYEVRFKDQFDNVYARKKTAVAVNAPLLRYEQRELAVKEKSQYHPSEVTITSSKIQETTPPPLPDLGQIGVLVGKKNDKFNSKDILDTYQRMYDDGVVSYPRTEDRKMTQAQFDILLNLKEKIATVVGVDPSLLTHTTLRRKHKTTTAAHGPNRPGVNVPSSLDEVQAKYGDIGVAIYDVVAKSFLSILCENYVYKEVRTQLVDYPDFVGVVNVPVELNFKKLVQSDKDVPTKRLSKFAKPYIFEGSNRPPEKPDRSFIITYLTKHGIGTGATRLSTLAAISDGKNPLVKESKKGYQLQYIGWIDAILAKGTYIADEQTTIKLFELMDKVRDLQFPADNVPKMMGTIVSHDMQIMTKNADLLVGDPHISSKHRIDPEKKKKQYYNLVFDGQETRFKRIWGGHEFTDEECQQLATGHVISFTATSKNGSSFNATGKLEWQEFKGKKFLGFKLTQPVHNDNYYHLTHNGKKVKFKRIWGGHEFTDEECQQLASGQEIHFTAKTKKGYEFEVFGVLAWQEFKGKKFLGFKQTNTKIERR